MLDELPKRERRTVLISDRYHPAANWLRARGRRERVIVIAIPLWLAGSIRPVCGIVARKSPGAEPRNQIVERPTCFTGVLDGPIKGFRAIVRPTNVRHRFMRTAGQHQKAEWQSGEPGDVTIVDQADDGRTGEERKKLRPALAQILRAQRSPSSFAVARRKPDISSVDALKHALLGCEFDHLSRTPSKGGRNWRSLYRVFSSGLILQPTMKAKDEVSCARRGFRCGNSLQKADAEARHRPTDGKALLQPGVEICGDYRRPELQSPAELSHCTIGQDWRLQKQPRRGRDPLISISRWAPPVQSILKGKGMEAPVRGTVGGPVGFVVMLFRLS